MHKVDPHPVDAPALGRWEGGSAEHMRQRSEGVGSARSHEGHALLGGGGQRGRCKGVV